MAFTNLITDRTQKDVDANNAKGSYNTSDLVRVDSCVQQLSDRLNIRGYAVTVVVPSGAYTEASHVPTIIEMSQYLRNLRNVRAALKLPPDTPIVPSNMEHLTYGTANDIERILLVISEQIDIIDSYSFFCGEIYSGEV